MRLISMVLVSRTQVVLRHMALSSYMIEIACGLAPRYFAQSQGENAKLPTTLQSTAASLLCCDGLSISD